MCGVSLFFTIIIIWDSKFKKVEKKILRKHFKFYGKGFICFFFFGIKLREIQEGLNFITGIVVRFKNIFLKFLLFIIIF